MSDDPAPNILREVYYPQQLLQVDDFQREQEFGLLFRLLSHRLLFTPGILSGLAVVAAQGTTTVTVSPGAALDAVGRFVTLVDQATLDGRALAAAGGGFSFSVDAPAFYTVGHPRTWRLAVTFAEEPVPGKQNQIRQVPSLSLTEVTGAGAVTPAGSVPLADVVVTATAPSPPPPPPPGSPPAAPLPPVVTVTVDRAVGAVTTVQSRRVPVLDAAQVATGTFSPDRIPRLPVSKIDGSVPIDWAHAPPMPAANIQGTLAAGQIPDLPAAKITGTLSANQLPTIPAAKIQGPLAVDQLPDLPTTRLTGTLTVAQLPRVPTTHLEGTLAVDQIPSLPMSKLTGTLNAAMLPPIDASKVSSGVLDAARIPNLDAAKVASGILSLERIPNIPASKVIGGGTGGGGAPSVWARGVAFYPRGLGIGSRVQAGAASGFFIGLVKTDTDQNRSYYALGIGFAAPLFSFNSPEIVQAGVRANVYSDRARYSLPAEGGVAGETVTRVRFVGVAPELGFELRTPEAQLPVASQGKIASFVVVGTRAADPTASVGAADIINALRGTISPFSFVALTSPDTSVPPAVAALAVQLQAQGWIAPDAAPVLAALQPGAFAADAAGLVTLLTTAFTASAGTAAQLAWSLAAAGISASVASTELGRFFAGRVSMTDLAQALAGAYPPPSVKQLVIQQQAATTSAQDAALPLAQASSRLAAPLPLGVLLRISFAGTASTPLQLAKALRAAGFTSQADVIAAIQQLFPTTAAHDVQAAVQQAYAN